MVFSCGSIRRADAPAPFFVACLVEQLSNAVLRSQDIRGCSISGVAWRICKAVRSRPCWVFCPCPQQIIPCVPTSPARILVSKMLRAFRNPSVAPWRFRRSRISATNTASKRFHDPPVSAGHSWLAFLSRQPACCAARVATADVQLRSCRHQNLILLQ